MNGYAHGVEWAIRELEDELRSTIILDKLSRLLRGGERARSGFFTNGVDLADAARRLRETCELLRAIPR